MSEKTVLIIGAGLAGLSTGCYARMNGFRTHILEHQSAPGGVICSWTRSGFLFDGGIHFLMDHNSPRSLHQVYRELGVFESNRLLDIERYIAVYDASSGRYVEITRDLERTAESLKAFSPSDSDIVSELFSAAAALRGLDMGAQMETPPELMGFADSMRQMWGMLKMRRFFFGKFGTSVRDYVQRIGDPWLREVILSLFFPDVPVWLVLVLLADLADGQLGLLESGSQGFVKAIEDRYRNLGGEISYGSTVEKILVKDDRAVGVRTSDGREITADVVVSAADGYSTIYRLLEGRYTNRAIDDRYSKWALFKPYVLVSLGVNRRFESEPHFLMMKLSSPVELAGGKAEWIGFRIFNHSDKFAPGGKTALQAYIETEWDWWDELQKKDRKAYDAEKERIARDVISRLEVRFPGISSQVEVTDVATPYTLWRYTLTHRASFEGFLPTPKTIMARIPKTLPGLDNFYMAGQWVQPGGGVPVCIYSGRHVVQILCRKLGRDFVTSVP